MKTIPKNYRKLKSTEVIRKGDLYRLKSDHKSIGLAGRHTFGEMPPVWWLYSFFRRRHVKKDETVMLRFPKTTEKKMPLVEFWYPHGLHDLKRTVTVKVISMGDTYLTGLEYVGESNSTVKWQFKKFRIDRMVGPVKLTFY